MIMKSQEILFEANKMVQNIERVNETADPTDFGNRIRTLDSHIVKLTRETDRHTFPAFNEESDASAAQTMWMVSRMLIHS